MSPNKQLKEHRLKQRLSSANAADRLSITPQHLSKLENTDQAPSRLLLEQMIELYRIPLEDADALRSGFGFPSQLPQGVQNVSLPPSPSEIAINIDAAKTPILFSNAMAISSDDHGIVLDVGQRVMSKNEIQIVTRVGLTLEHAERMNEQLGTHIGKLRRNMKDKEG